MILTSEQDVVHVVGLVSGSNWTSQRKELTVRWEIRENTEGRQKNMKHGERKRLWGAPWRKNEFNFGGVLWDGLQKLFLSRKATQQVLPSAAHCTSLLYRPQSYKRLTNLKLHESELQNYKIPVNSMPDRSGRVRSEFWPFCLHLNNQRRYTWGISP